MVKANSAATEQNEGGQVENVDLRFKSVNQPLPSFSGGLP
jgi:hypothetical protein